MSLPETALVYYRLCQLACRLDDPEQISELRRLGAIYREEYSCLPEWVREAAGLKDAGMEPANNKGREARG